MPILIKLYQKRHWGGGKAALGMGQIGSELWFPMTTDNFHRVIMGKTVLSLFLGHFSSNLF